MKLVFILVGHYGFQFGGVAIAGGNYCGVENIFHGGMSNGSWRFFLISLFVIVSFSLIYTFNLVIISNSSSCTNTSNSQKCT